MACCFQPDLSLLVQLLSNYTMISRSDLTVHLHCCEVGFQTSKMQVIIVPPPKPLTGQERETDEREVSQMQCLVRTALSFCFSGTSQGNKNAQFKKMQAHSMLCQQKQYTQGRHLTTIVGYWKVEVEQFISLADELVPIGRLISHFKSAKLGYDGCLWLCFLFY